MSSDNNEVAESSKKESSDIMKKLNDAFSSYLDGKETTSTEGDSSEDGSLLELVRSGIIEKQKQVMEVIPGVDATNTPVEELNEDEVETLLVSDVDETEINAIIPDVLSGVFDDFQYQSVEIEIAETKDDAGEKESISHYSTSVTEILKKNPNVSDKPVSTDKKDNLLVASLHAKDNLSLKDSVPKLKPKDSLDSDYIVVSRAFIKKPLEPAKPKPEPKGLTNSHDTAKKESSSSTLLSEVPSGTSGVKEVKKVESTKPLQSKSTQKVPQSPVISKNVKKHKVPEKAGINDSDKPVNIAFLYNKDHTSHDAASLSLTTHERPERLIKAMWYLEKNKVFEDGTCILTDKFEMADEADLLRVHEESYISFVRSYASAGGGFLGDSTYMTKTSFDIAKMAAGAAIRAGDMVVDKEFSHAFVLARPPGHHASSQKYGGFCLFNNAAVLARHLQKRRNVGKILILDWDAHAGDGTMEIFYEDPTVMFMSLHRDPHGFYPRKGFSTQIGEKSGKGYTINVEMPEGAGNEEYMMAFDEAILPLIRHFAPEVIIFSCGFDAYYREKNIGLTLDSDGYHHMTSKVLSVFNGPMVFLMEGGYHDFNGQLCHSVLNALHGKPNPVSDRQEISSYKQNLKKQIFADTQKKVEESKKTNPVLSSQVSG
ncbi:histone deacetylase [Methanolobus sp.]|uniref:histone deacetylase family protein n=1 Tax=Methanolobus sp. TaxID=1874737 RepID=UPI0025E6AB47|nr:histone deacetylase [Methanolobus sp.]